MRLGTARAAALVPWLVATSLALQWLPVVQGLWPATAFLSVIGLPAAAQLIKLLRDHHDQPERVTGSKFLALRFQVLSGLGSRLGWVLLHCWDGDAAGMAAVPFCAAAADGDRLRAMERTVRMVAAARRPPEQPVELGGGCTNGS